MIVVLDTNVLVSALLNPLGRPADVLRLVQIGALRLAYDARILDEYRRVLRRPRFPFAGGEIGALLESFAGEGLAVTPPPVAGALPDPADRPFLEVAAAAGATLVTGNRRHYPARVVGSVPVQTPAEFLRALAAT